MIPTFFQKLASCIWKITSYFVAARNLACTRSCRKIAISQLKTEQLSIRATRFPSTWRWISSKIPSDAANGFSSSYISSWLSFGSRKMILKPEVGHFEAPFKFLHTISTYYSSTIIYNVYRCNIVPRRDLGADGPALGEDREGFLLKK